MTNIGKSYKRTKKDTLVLKNLRHAKNAGHQNFISDPSAFLVAVRLHNKTSKQIKAKETEVTMFKEE